MYMLLHGRAPVEKSGLISLHGSLTLTIFRREKVDDGVRSLCFGIYRVCQHWCSSSLATVGNGLTRSMACVVTKARHVYQRASPPESSLYLSKDKRSSTGAVQCRTASQEIFTATTEQCARRARDSTVAGFVRRGDLRSGFGKDKPPFHSRLCSLRWFSSDWIGGLAGWK